MTFTSAALCAPLLLAVSGSPQAKVALAMEGGGWRAQSGYAGVVSGLMAYVSREHGVSTPTLSSTGLLDRFDHFSSVSGGSWFFASMAYSERYNWLLNNMAASPGTAATAMSTNWTTPILEATKVDPSRWNIVKRAAENIADKIFGKGDTESLLLLSYFLATNATWNNFIAVQLQAAAGIGPDVKMGSDVLSWAKGKVWLCDHSVMLPSGDKFAQLYQTDIVVPSVRYKAESSNAIPMVTPAQFSVVMGSGEDSAAPHPYIASTAAVEDVDLNFRAVVVPIIDEPDAVSGPLDLFDYSDGVLTNGAGRLPVIDVVSASSAAAGIAPVLGLLADEGLRVTDADLTPWVSNTADGSAFATAIELVQDLKRFGGVNQNSMDTLARAKVHGLIDGAYTDDIGLANAVAAGASEVVMLLDSDSSATSFHVELLCQNGPAPKIPYALQSAIFEEPASMVRSIWQDLQTLELQNTKFLKKFAIGSFNLTTVDNSYYGVDSGRSVTIHAVQLCADVTIGEFEDLANYNTYVQELVETIVAVDNSAMVTSILLPMFIGSADSVVV